MIGRGDVISHQPWIRSRLKLIEKGIFSTCNLGAIIREIRYGTGTPPPYLEPGQDTVPFVRATDIKDGEIKRETLFHISKEQPKSMDKCRLSGNELIIVRSGVNTGDCAVIPEDLSGAYAAYDLILTFAPSALPHFISVFLDTEIGRLQLNLVKGRAAQPHINADEVSALRIPLPKISEQKNLVAAMDAARSERRAKLAEADALLAGLDDFLLSTLGLTPPPKDERKVFAATIRAVQEQSHLNADYFHPERIHALRAITSANEHISCAKLSDVAAFIRNQMKIPGQNYLGLAHIQSHTGELVDANEEVAGACSEFKKGDVLFARLRPYLNKVHCAETDGCCSPEFHVMRIFDPQKLLPDYLAAILRSALTLAQTRHMMTGNTHPRLSNEDVINLTIPVPTVVEVQQTIAAEAHRRREEARRLRAEAETGWQAAKRWFEAQLLGNSI
jgi:hypothetical protein